MSATTTHPYPPPPRRLPEPSAAPRLVPERGQVLRNVIRTVFSCFCFTGERQRVPQKAKRSRRSSTVSPLYT
ncbi:hypothetical protein HanRHA438_Chr08g0350381 [Helianthus annuus]|nr:hypothetical protein HanIR_Chr08g0366341 [Helianthus annuus]KAJ0897862.1 hypothetical protein HanRHA438_Chr08g0350381 [Helianthus annuus]